MRIDCVGCSYRHVPRAIQDFKETDTHAEDIPDFWGDTESRSRYRQLEGIVTYFRSAIYSLQAG